MEQLTRRNGWQEAETALLWQEIEKAAVTGETLRSVFDRMGEKLERKPNSVRNYYYMQLRSREGAAMRRAAPFETFSREEINALLREVLTAQGRGESVRSCVMRLSRGDQKRMLRLQNKYRSVLSKRPEWVSEIAEELTREGIPCMMPQAQQTLPPLRQPDVQDADAQALYRAVENLLRRAQESDPRGDRARAQRDVCLMQLEELQQASGELVQICKEVCAERSEMGADSVDRMTNCLSRVENLLHGLPVA
ncbi:MAG: hypothetical protein E7326_01515 [Clostridiales bacterium]|nr:hypothetical protein [Clostridiales bacterium]